MAGGRLGAEIRDLGRLFDLGRFANLGDEQLLDRFATRRDGPAFEALVARHGPMVLATCRGVLKDPHAAEDAFQATFLTLARKAGSLRSADSLGAWLHRVARRIASEANAAAVRRRRFESPGRSIEAVDPRPIPPGDGDEDWPILHEEIDRLPERYRAPIVLCYLEGMTHEQAAGHLRWPVGTVGGRLARARDLMRGRLIRRGVTATLAALVASPRLARSAVPETLERSTVAAATGGLASAAATLMSDLMMKGMLVTKLKIASTAALTLAMLALTIGVKGAKAGRPEAPKVEQVSAPSTKAPVGESSTRESVRVVDPDGRPVAGARVYRSATRFRTLGRDPIAPSKLAETGPDGVFQLPADVTKAATGYEENIVAAVDGYGPAFGFGPPFADSAVADGMKRLQLARDDVPIHGRVLDIQGRPVAGASVQIVGILWSPSGTLDEWLTALKEEKGAYPVQNRLLRSWSSDDIPSLYPAVATDAQGRFTLRGVGRERVAELVISGPQIETRFENVATRDMPSVTYPRVARLTSRPGRDVVYHGASFDFVAGPGLEVVGTVRDKDTGRPLPGIVVETLAPFGNPIRNLRTTTDAEGRYRIAGVTAMDDNGQAQGLVASSKDGPPYLGTVMPVGEGPGIITRAPGTVTRDFGLKRGAWARGKVVDQATGRPIRAGVDYFIPGDNPHLKDYPRYATVHLSPGLEVDEHGEYKLVVIPGRGILAARIGSGPYRMAVGVEKIAGMTPMGPGRPTFLPAQPSSLNPSIFNTLIEINPKEGEESITVDIALDPGRTIRGTLVGPGGEPVAGAMMLGAKATEQWTLQPLPSAEFEVISLGPDGKRGLIFWHEAKGLAGDYVIRPGEEGPLTVKLRPGATWTGRLVDDEGQPLAGIQISSNGRSPINTDDSRFELGTLPRGEPIRTDKEGRFRVSGIVPGLKYTLFVTRDRKVGVVVEDGIAAPGEVKDLGDVRALPPRRP